MKKIISLFVLLLLVCGCTNKTSEEKITIVSPSGAPSLSLIDILNDENINIDIVDGSEVLQAEFSNGKADIIIAPVNLGVKLSMTTNNYKLASVITWGNLYLVSRNNEYKSGKVAAFGEAAIPGKVIGLLKDELSDYEFEWYSAVNEASAMLLSKQYDCALLAEPILTATKAKSEDEIYEIINIQELYKKVTGFDSYPQAAIFVKDESTNDILEKINTSVSENNADNESLSNKLDSIDIKQLGFENPNLIKKAYSKMAINYVKASDCKEEISTFLKQFNIELDDSIIMK